MDIVAWPVHLASEVPSIIFEIRWNSYCIVTECPFLKGNNNLSSGLDSTKLKLSTDLDGGNNEHSRFQNAPFFISAISWSHVDAILLSNAYLLSALPFVIFHVPEFRGRIFGTRPTIDFGGLMLLENTELPFSSAEKEMCLSKIHPLAYHQTISLSGPKCLRLTPIPNGYTLGSCHWWIETENQRVLYITACSRATIDRFPEPWDMSKSNLPGPIDVLLMRDVMVTSSSYEGNYQILLNKISMTLTRKGNCVLPCSSGPLLFELLERVEFHLRSVGLAHIPIFYVSPTASSCLAHSGILGEWTNETYREKLYIPEESIVSAILLKEGRVQCYPSVSDTKFIEVFREPCVIFVAHASLQTGDIFHFREMFQHDPKHVFLLTEKDVVSREILTQWKSRVTLVSIPLDPRLTRHELMNCISHLSPSRIVSTVPLDLAIPRIDEIHILKPWQSLKLDYAETDSFETGYVDPRLATSLLMKPWKADERHEQLTPRWYAMLTAYMTRRSRTRRSIVSGTLEITPLVQESHVLYGFLMGNLLIDQKANFLSFHGYLDVSELLKRLAESNLRTILERPSGEVPFPDEPSKVAKPIGSFVVPFFPLVIRVIEWQARILLHSPSHTTLVCQCEMHRRWLQDCLQRSLIAN
jgi:Cft2 family RNA processing exonuclease